MTTINERIRELRKYYGLTQKEFAQKLGLSREHLCRIEAGKEKPSEQTLLLVTSLFEVADSWLYDGVGEMICNHHDGNAPEILRKAIEDISDIINLSKNTQDDMIESLILLFKMFNKISNDNEKVMLLHNIFRHLHDIINQSTKIKNTISATDYIKAEEIKMQLINDVSNLFIS